MKLTSVLLITLLLSSAGARVAAASPRKSQTGSRAEKVKAGVKKLGVGESARVEVELSDGTKLKGYLRESGEDGFVVVEKKTGAARTITYEQVERLKGGGGMSNGAKVAIGFGIAAAVLGTMVLIGLAHAD